MAPGRPAIPSCSAAPRASWRAAPLCGGRTAGYVGPRRTSGPRGSAQRAARAGGRGALGRAHALPHPRRPH
eukprot:2262791-Pleurochrysis_carterae.AAC.1